MLDGVHRHEEAGGVGEEDGSAAMLEEGGQEGLPFADEAMVNKAVEVAIIGRTNLKEALNDVFKYIMDLGSPHDTKEAKCVPRSSIA
jgi:hypothetical protein